MNPELVTKAPPDAVRRNALDVAKRRNVEANDAMDFRFLGDDEGRHAEKCVHDVPCSRNYDPLEAPDDTRMYEGTGVGALYGLGDEVTTTLHKENGHVTVTRSLVAELAGWNLEREGSL